MKELINSRQENGTKWGGHSYRAAGTFTQWADCDTRDEADSIKAEDSVKYPNADWKIVKLDGFYRLFISK